MTKFYDYVLDRMSEREVLELMAEEAAELSQAALKLIRARGLSNNPTPVQDVAATFNLREEMVDVLICMMLYGVDLGYFVKKAEGSPKWKRMADRFKDIEAQQARMAKVRGEEK